MICATNIAAFHLGYNYLAKGDKLKFMLDNAIRSGKENLKDYFVTLQVQMFFI
jgi:hypothetical protein